MVAERTETIEVIATALVVAVRSRSVEIQPVWIVLWRGTFLSGFLRR